MHPTFNQAPTLWTRLDHTYGKIYQVVTQDHQGIYQDFVQAHNDTQALNLLADAVQQSLRDPSRQRPNLAQAKASPKLIELHQLEAAEVTPLGKAKVPYITALIDSLRPIPRHPDQDWQRTIVTAGAY